LAERPPPQAASEPAKSAMHNPRRAALNKSPAIFRISCDRRVQRYQIKPISQLSVLS
jgi:hypothetical protein